MTHYHLRVVADDKTASCGGLPKGEKALHIVSMSGAVLNGRVHAHITFADDETALGGHLEEACRVLTFAVVCLGVLADDGDLARSIHAPR